MRVSIDDLKRFGLYESLPDKLQKLGAGQYYAFYYRTIDEESKLKVFADDIVQNVNIALYRELNSMASSGKISEPDAAQATVGYFGFDSFESRCGIFYLFLNTYCEKAAVESFYEWCVTSDVAGDYAISTSAMNDIYERSSFERVIAFFATDTRISSVMRVYDMVDSYLRTKTGQSLYGAYIKRVVQLIPYEGGVLPERNGDLRFMVIGEKAVLTETEAIKLESAKGMLRSLVQPVEIYKATGWYFNAADGKWRHNTTDVGAYIASDHLIKVETALVYSPPTSPIGLAQVNLLFKNPELIYDMGYAGRISDVLKHPTLFQRYPVLANLPLLFRNTPKVKFGTFYQSANNLGGYMVIDGNGTNVNLVSVMLHESQHAIQRLEGFGTGGNEFLASFVMSIGGDNVRRVFYSIKGLQKTLLNKILDESSFQRIKDIVSRLYDGNKETKGLKELLVGYTLDFDKFRNNLDSFALYTTYYLTAAKQLVSGEFIEFLYDLTGGTIYELTELLEEGMEKSEVFADKLMAEGYREQDVRRILFNAYEDLMGETESRSVQHQMMLEGKYSNYFYLYEWEHAPSRKIAVINDEYVEVDTKTLAGAVEKIKDGYIMHFKKCSSVEPFLHELGHIVDDILCSDEYGSIIDAEYAKTMTKKNRSEFFVDCFLGYVRDHLFDSNIQKDLAMNFDLKRNEHIDEMLDTIFDVKEVNGGFLKYVTTVTAAGNQETKKFDLGGEIVAKYFKDTPDENIRSEIADILYHDAYGYYDKPQTSVIADAILNVDEILLKFSPDNPIITKFGERACFYPNQKLIAQQGIKNAYIKYAAHLVTSGIPRKRDSSKERAIVLVEDALRNAGSRYLQHTERDGEQVERIIYVKEFHPKNNIGFVLEVELENDKIQVVTIMPNQTESGIKNKIGKGVWKPASPISLRYTAESSSENATVSSRQKKDDDLETESKDNK